MPASGTRRSRATAWSRSAPERSPATGETRRLARFAEPTGAIGQSSSASTAPRRAWGRGSSSAPSGCGTTILLEERQHWIVLEEAGVLRGYVSFRLLQTEPHARVRADVRELVAPDDAARRRLFAALGALGDQVGDVTIALAGDDPFDWAFLDGDRDRPGTKDVEHAQGVVNTGPMIRLVDVRRALLARGYAEEGSLELGIGEEPPFTLRVGPRAGEASVVESGEERAPRALRMSASTLASVAFGGLRLEDAVRLGWLGTPDAAAVRVGSALLRLPAFFSADSF